MVRPDLVLNRDEAGSVRSRKFSTYPFELFHAELNLMSNEGGCVFDGIDVTWRILAQKPGRLGSLKQIPGCELFDADKVGSRIVLRHWRPGDRFQPIGMVKSLKLQDLFTNLKVPAARRRALALAATARGEIFWVEGVRISERFKLDKHTKRRLKWQWHRP